MAESSVAATAIKEPPLTPYERKQFDRMTGAMGQLYLADLGALLAAVEEMRNSGQTRFGSSLHEVYERLIPWPVYADSKEEIKETLDAYRQ